MPIYGVHAHIDVTHVNNEYRRFISAPWEAPREIVSLVRKAFYGPSTSLSFTNQRQFLLNYYYNNQIYTLSLTRLVPLARFSPRSVLNFVAATISYLVCSSAHRLISVGSSNLTVVSHLALCVVMTARRST